jgi:hypothetical protein
MAWSKHGFRPIRARIIYMLFYNFLYHAESLGRRMLPRLKSWNSLKHYTVCGAVVCFKEKALRRPGQRPLEDEGLWKTKGFGRRQWPIVCKRSWKGKAAWKAKALRRRRQKPFEGKVWIVLCECTPFQLKLASIPPYLRSLETCYGWFRRCSRKFASGKPA